MIGRPRRRRQRYTRCRCSIVRLPVGASVTCLPGRSSLGEYDGGGAGKQSMECGVIRWHSYPWLSLGWCFNKPKSGEKMQEIPYSTVKSREDGRNVKTSSVQRTCWKKYHIRYITQDSCIFNRMYCRISYPVAVMLNILRAAPLKKCATMV